MKKHVCIKSNPDCSLENLCEDCLDYRLDLEEDYPEHGDEFADRRSELHTLWRREY
jgi:hypothetical protein